MKRLFENVSKWLTNREEREAKADDLRTSSMPEHERRLRELEKSGRVLFLP
jgi:hypothetical protein